MRRRLALLAPAIAMVVTAALPGAAVSAEEDWKYSTSGSCGSDGERALGIIEVGVGGTVIGYIDDRNFVQGNGFWVYREDNGIKRLQRGGTWVDGSKDNCQDNRFDTEPALPEGKKPDTVLF